MSTILITGVNGFIGSHLATHLAARGHRIVGSTSREAGLRIATPGVAHKVVFDLGGPCDEDIVRGVDVVIHCGWDSRPGATRANIEGTRRLLDVAEGAGVPYQLFLTSYSAHPLAVSEYGRAKLVVQEECLRRGLTVVRPGLVVGAGGLFQRMSDTVTRYLVVPLVDGGRHEVPIVAVEDLQRALTEIIERRLTGLFSLFNPGMVTLKALMLEIRASNRRRTLLVPVPSSLLLGPLWLLDKAGITPPINVDSVRGLRANIHAGYRSDLPTFVPRPLRLAEMVRTSRATAAVRTMASFPQRKPVGLLRWLRDRLVEPRLLSVEIDGDQRIATHRQVLLEKPSLQRLFQGVYRLCVDLDDRHFSGVGPRVELGAGSSIFKELSPEVIATDIQLAPHLDMVVDALRLPFRAASIRAFYGIECFHHLDDPDLFFTELRRTLLPGGGCILIEPYHGLVARQVYRRLFDSESFDPDQIEWRTPTTGPMLGANQALSYIVFTRDRDKFQAQYPDLRIVRQFPLNNYLRYLGSGGVNFRALLPDFLVPVARLGEIALSPLNRIVALHHVIVLRYEPVPVGPR